ncbi:MAG: peroxiredoxin [Deltaproteobacteria bacterium]|nr:peroxiredoxin [Deltaproteobacteria bacterium]
MRRLLTLLVLLLGVAGTAAVAPATDLEVGNSAPLFTATTQDGQRFDLAARKGSWTVLFFYPKAGTPGCTKQVCAFRDSIAKIRAEGAEVYGISTNTVAEQKAFADEHRLAFTLLADPDGTVTELYGAKMPVLTVAKRWTFIIDPTLTIRQIEHDVDPALDAQRVAAELAKLKGAAAPAATPAP